jgi:hypothetical protein
VAHGFPPTAELTNPPCCPNSLREAALVSRCGALLFVGLGVSFFPGSQFLVALWRRDIVKARIKLVSEQLPAPRQDAIWSGIDCREWFIKMVADDYHAEMETIDRMLEAELRR